MLPENPQHQLTERQESRVQEAIINTGVSGLKVRTQTFDDRPGMEGLILACNLTPFYHCTSRRGTMSTLCSLRLGCKRPRKSPPRPRAGTKKKNLLPW